MERRLPGISRQDLREIRKAAHFSWREWHIYFVDRQVSEFTALIDELSLTGQFANLTTSVNGFLQSISNLETFWVNERDVQIDLASLPQFWNLRTLTSMMFRGKHPARRETSKE